jgi:hypothetical protein
MAWSCMGFTYMCIIPDSILTVYIVPLRWMAFFDVSYWGLGD